MTTPSLCWPPTVVSKTHFSVLQENCCENEVWLPWKTGVVVFNAFLRSWLATHSRYGTELIEKIIVNARDGDKVSRRCVEKALNALFDFHPFGVPIRVDFLNKYAIDPKNKFDLSKTLTVFVTQVLLDPNDEWVFVEPTLFKLFAAATTEDVVFYPWFDSPSTNTHEVTMSKRSMIKNCCLCLEGEVLYFGLLQLNAGQRGYDARLGVFINSDSGLAALNVLEALRAAGSFPAKSEDPAARLLHAYIAGVMRRAEMNELGAYDVVMPIEDEKHSQEHAFLMSVVL